MFTRSLCSDSIYAALMQCLRPTTSKSALPLYFRRCVKLCALGLQFDCPRPGCVFVFFCYYYVKSSSSSAASASLAGMSTLRAPQKRMPPSPRCSPVGFSTHQNEMRAIRRTSWSSQEPAPHTTDSQGPRLSMSRARSGPLPVTVITCKP